jgi:hypothetical protein
MIVKLNKKQFDYLNSGLSEEEKLKLKLKHIGKESQIVFIEIDDDTADKMRDWASDELQKKGFDLNYELTPEGELLEILIDEFYIG